MGNSARRLSGPDRDKLLIVCIFIALGVTGRLPSWLVIMVVSRDVLIVIAVVLSWLLGNPTPMKPLAVSKINTVVQLCLPQQCSPTRHSR